MVSELVTIRDDVLNCSVRSMYRLFPGTNTRGFLNVDQRPRFPFGKLKASAEQGSEELIERMKFVVKAKTRGFGFKSLANYCFKVNVSAIIKTEVHPQLT